MTSCPVCGSDDTRARPKRGDWVCDDCDHAWPGPSREAASGPEPAAFAPPPVAVFLSYGHADASEFVTRLRADLAARGVDPVWLDSDMIGAGGLWTAAIEQGIRGSDVVLAVMSEHSLRADSVCHDEVALAVAHDKRVVPVRPGGGAGIVPSLLLVRRSWVDFGAGYDAALERLLAALRGDEAGLVAPLASVAGQRPLDFGPELAAHARGFTGRAWLDAELDGWLALPDAGRAFVIVGEPGIGKSAIAAHLAARPDAAAVHFCWTGNSDTLAPLALVGSVVAALGARVPGFGVEVARRHPEEAREDAATAFRQLVVEPARAIDPPASPQLLIVDALDEAALRQGETIVDLVAAHAPSLPPWLRIVATTRPEPAVLARIRHLRPVTVEAARAENRADIAEYLAARLAPIGVPAAALAALADRAAGNFLYAAMAADALALGDISAGDIAALPPGLDAFYALAFSRRFPDPERFLADTATFLRPLAAAFAPLPFGVLAAASGLDPSALNLRLAGVRSYLRVEGAGDAAAYALFHRSVADWLADRGRNELYWCDPAAGHAALAVVLDRDPASSPYAVRVLPRHLAALGRWDRLAALLSHLDFLAAAWDAGRQDVQAAWASVESHSRLCVTGAYRVVMEDPGAHDGGTVRRIGTLLRLAGHPAEAIALREHLVASYRRSGNREGLATALVGLAVSLLADRNDLDGAMALLREHEAICREISDRAGLAASLGNQALVLGARGDLDGAMALHKQEERIDRELGDRAGLAASLGNQALVLRARGDLDGAMALHMEGERIDREIGDRAGLAASLGNQALILRARGDLDGATALLQEQERIDRDLGYRDGIKTSLGNQASILLARGDPDGAATLLQEHERICRELGSRDGLGVSLRNQAECLLAAGRLAEALPRIEEAVALAREIGSAALAGRLKLLEQIRKQIAETPH